MSMQGLQDLLSGVELDAGEILTAEEARTAVAAVCLMALCDEVLTAEEKKSIRHELGRRWGIGISAGALDRMVSELVAAPRPEVLGAALDALERWPDAHKQPLIEVLVAVVASDDNLSLAEYRLLRRMADVLGESLDDLSRYGIDPRAAEASEVIAKIPLEEGRKILLGRSAEAQIRLPRAPIDGVQASLELRDGRLSIRDLGSEPLLTRGTEVLAQHEVLDSGDEVGVGRYVLRFESEPSRIVVRQRGATIKLEVRDLSFSVPYRGTRRSIFRGLSFWAHAGTMVAVIGPSGCGKSSLLNALAGISRTDGGAMTLDGVAIEPGLGAVTRRISFVPQDDLLFAGLTVEESISMTAQLKGLQRSSGDLEGLTSEIMERLGLNQEEVRESRIGDAVRRGISGGQRKRVSVAQELVGDDTDVVLLDEPTSGLDPRTEAGVMLMLREIADSGKIVVCTTHGVLGGLTHFDKVLCLSANGEPAYFGRPSGLLHHFGIASMGELYQCLEEGLDGSPLVSPGGSPGPGLKGEADGEEKVPPKGGKPLGLISQLPVLARRQWMIRTRDTPGLVLALALPLAVILILKAFYLPGCLEPSGLFILGLACVWAGISFTIRDLIADFAVIRHETRFRTSLFSTYGSKVFIAALASALQALLLVAILFPVLGVGDIHQYGDWVGSEYGGILRAINLMSPMHVFFLLFAAYVFGNALGLFLSSFFNTAAAAIFMIPLVLLPSIVAGGILVAPKDLPQWSQPLLRVNPLYWTYTGLLASSASICHAKPDDVIPPVPADGVGAELRTVQPPEDSFASAYVVPEQAFVYNSYQPVDEWYEEIGLEGPLEAVPPEERALPIRRIWSAHFRTAVAALGGLALILHAGALLLLRRRVRRTV
ncbi:MAG: ATP-binding cassette domain-containing protein [Acidobacteriota bacterium]|nr:ATP-binding cassette domain-containing protein [Acidobacteriota bacterium]